MPNLIDENANGKKRIKVTKRSVESLEPLETGALIRYDEKLAGFGVRVMPSRRRFYFVRYRNKHGRSRWFAIGEHGRVTADVARTKAQRILQTVAVDGRDPSGEREAFRAAPTVNDLLNRYRRGGASRLTHSIFSRHRRGPRGRSFIMSSRRLRSRPRARSGSRPVARVTWPR